MSVLGVIRKIADYGYDGFETGFANVQGQFDSAAAARRQIEATFIASSLWLKIDPTKPLVPEAV